jgi:hypothetical protein
VRGILPPLAAAALLVAGCGGDDGRSAEEWAGGVCTELNEWVDELDATFDSISEGGIDLDEDDIRSAADRIAEATEDLQSGLSELGAPEIDSGRRAQEEVEALAERLRRQLDEVEAALAREREPLAAVATVAEALAAAARRLQQTLESLARLDPAGELADGFQNSEECDTLRERVAGSG